MSGRPAYDRRTYRADIKHLLARGRTKAEVATELGLSRATVYRILEDRPL